MLPVDVVVIGSETNLIMKDDDVIEGVVLLLVLNLESPSYAGPSFSGV